MTDSKDNAEKSKPNHLHTMFDEKFNNVDPDIELEDQDAIDKLLVDTGFDVKQEADDFDSLDDFLKFDDFGGFEDSPVEPVPTNSDSELVVENSDENESVVDHIDADELESDSLNAVDDFADIEDFSDFVDPVIEPIAVEEELVPIIDVPDELTIEDSIDYLLAETGFDDGIEQEHENAPLIDEFADEDEVAEPMSVDDLIADESEGKDEHSEQTSIAGLAAVHGFDNVDSPHVEENLVVDEFSELDDFNDFVEPEPELVPISTEENLSPVADEFGIDEFVDLAPDVNVLADTEINEGQDSLKPAVVDDSPVVADEFGIDDEFAGLDPEINALVDTEIDEDQNSLKSGIDDEVTDDSPVMVDEFGIDDEFADLAPDVNVLADTEINEGQDSLKPGVADDSTIDAFGTDEFTNLIDDDSSDFLTTSVKPEAELDEDALVAAQLALMGKSGLIDSDEFLALDEIGDDLFVDSEVPAAPTDEFSEQSTGRNTDGENDFLLADFDITADTDFPGLAESITEDKDDSPESDFATPFAQNALDEPTLIPEAVEQLEPILDEKPDAVASADNSQNDAIAQLKSEQERLDKLYKKQLNETEVKAKKTATFGYIALAVGIVALGLAGGMGWVAITAKSELSPLTESVKTIQADLNSQKPDQELSEVKASVEQLNQKIDGVITQLKGPAPGTQEPLQDDPLGSAIKPGEKDVINKSLDVAPLHVPDGHSPSTSPSGIDANKSHEASTKPEAAKAAEVVKGPPIADEKKTPAPHSDTKAGSPKKKPVKTIKRATQAKNVTRLDWSVNLIAYRQDWYAKSKASEYIQKGVPVEVVPVEISGVLWYRLRVSGFRNKAEADAYALRVKKALNLSSVWVGDI